MRIDQFFKVYIQMFGSEEGVERNSNFFGLFYFNWEKFVNFLQYFLSEFYMFFVECFFMFQRKMFLQFFIDGYFSLEKRLYQELLIRLLCNKLILIES